MNQTALTTRTIRPRGRFRAGEIYLGWRYCASEPDRQPEPEPHRWLPAQVELTGISEDWLAAQRREQRLLDGSAWLGLAAALVEATSALAAWLAGALREVPALLVLVVAGGSATWCVARLLRGQRALRAQIRAEHDRVDHVRQAQLAALAAQDAHIRRSRRDWQRQRVRSGGGPHWHPVTVPVDVGRIDVAGGTPAGWSALITTITAARLATGGRVTVVDLTGSDTTADAVQLASASGIAPHVRVLPAALPSLTIGARLTAGALADVLALTAAALDPGGPADPACDAALIGQALRCLGPGASLAQLLAALRVLAQAGAAREQLDPAGLSRAQVTSLLAMFGRGAEHLVTDRAWTLESRLRPLAQLGARLEQDESQTGADAGRLQVVRLDRAAPATASRTLASFLTVTVTEALRQAPAGEPWAHTICLLGAERMPSDMLDRLGDAAEGARAGLVLAHRSLPAPVRERLGRGNATVAFMRLGNADDARAAAEQIGTEHRFVISQLTDTIGASLTGTAGGSTTGTIGITGSVADSRSATWTSGRGSGRAAPGPLAAAQGSVSREVSSSAGFTDSQSITEALSTSTSWGWNTTRALGTSSSLAGTAQRSREFVAEQHELQHLPHTAVLICQSGAAGREVVLADANPAIMALPGATLARRPARD